MVSVERKKLLYIFSAIAGVIARTRGSVVAVERDPTRLGFLQKDDLETPGKATERSSVA